MRFASIIRVEGVLFRDDAVFGAPTLQGKLLVKGFAPQMQLFFRTRLDNRVQLVEWLQIELGIMAPKVLGPEDDDPITTVRYLGWDVQFYVDQSPADVALAMHKGVTGIVFASPEYQRPEFRPDARSTSPREWDLIVAEIEAQRAEKASDPRKTDDFQDQRFGD